MSNDQTGTRPEVTWMDLTDEEKERFIREYMKVHEYDDSEYSQLRQSAEVGGIDFDPGELNSEFPEAARRLRNRD